ncbi:hypothetical protein GCM10027347_02170 [Larkinella harenae]
MELTDAIQLIKTEQIHSTTPSIWADLGCGSGLFTRALAHYLTAGSQIYAIDTTNPLQLEKQPNGVELVPMEKDFVRDDLALPALDGILMANSFHYAKNKTDLLATLNSYLKPGGHFLLVEYDTDTPVPTWVPYPISFVSLVRLCSQIGYGSVEKLHQQPSRFGGQLYAALISTTP